MQMKIKFTRLSLTALLVLGLSLALVAGVSAAVRTDQADYQPGSVVTVSGDNNDGAGFLAGEAVHVDVNGPNGYVAACDAVADDAGAWACQVTLAGDETAIGDYTYTATGQDSGVSQSGAFSDTKPEDPGKPTEQPPTEPPATPVIVSWDGNGASGGYCNDFIDDPDMTPETGQQGWLFILTSPFDNSGSQLTTSFNPSYQTPSNPISGLHKGGGGGSYHFIVYTKADAQLVSASATNGTDNSNLTVSHCEKGGGAQDLTVSKTATPSYTRTFGWTIEKSSDFDQIKTAGSATFNYAIQVTKDAGTDSDWAVSGTITVNNPNTFDVSGVDVTDVIDNGGTCTVTPASLDVAAGSDATADYACTFTANPGSGTNTVTATWPDIGSPHTSATDTADYTFGDPTKLVNDKIDVTDTNGGSWQFSDSGSVTYSKTYNDPAGTCTDHTNVAKITQTGDSSSKTVEVCVGADLTVTKDATPSFTRTYNWSITKGVTPTLVEQFGGTATFNYIVTVTGTGYTDSDWAVAGTIHVVNPNDWEPITFNASDAVLGGVCTVTGGTGVVLAAGASVDLPYSCTVAAKPDYNTDIVNTATATWDSAAYYTPDDSASGDATFQFTTPTTEINKTVTVKDNFNGTEATLGTVNYPGSGVFNYSHTVNVPTWDCVKYNNTATIVETGQTASQTVEVCGPAKTGALTMGYWQNKNGQDQIKNAGVVSGTTTCKLTPFLRQYAPFQDLSATASCSTVATYVTNVIKVANASGASMNAMLKAQMLATALDVYFNPKIGTDYLIDLTKINKPIGSNSFENVSGAFGGANSLTVSQMLAYAASKSNVGGTMWYGNVKATQELAKDAFDAINNQKVFAP